MSTKPVKRCSTSLLARKMQIKTRKPPKLLKRLTLTSGYENTKHLKLSSIAGGNIKRYSHFGKLVFGPLLLVRHTYPMSQQSYS